MPLVLGYRFRQPHCAPARKRHHCPKPRALPQQRTGVRPPAVYTSVSGCCCPWRETGRRLHSHRSLAAPQLLAPSHNTSHARTA